MNRTEHAADWLSEIARALEVTLHTYPAARWEAEAPADPTNLHRPFGYCPPSLTDLHASPDVIVGQAADADLDDERFQDYLNALEIHMYGHITHWGDPNIEALLDEGLWVVGPGSVELMSRVQMIALDKRCVR